MPHRLHRRRPRAERRQRHLRQTVSTPQPITRDARRAGRATCRVHTVHAEMPKTYAHRREEKKRCLPPALPPSRAAQDRKASSHRPALDAGGPRRRRRPQRATAHCAHVRCRQQRSDATPYGDRRQMLPHAATKLQMPMNAPEQEDRRLIHARCSEAFIAPRRLVNTQRECSCLSPPA